MRQTDNRLLLKARQTGKTSVIGTLYEWQRRILVFHRIQKIKKIYQYE